jgi:hypothetical protein
MRIFIAGHDMRFRPASAELVEGSTAKLQFKLAIPVGSSSISGTPTVACSDLTFASTALSGTNLTTIVSGGDAGQNNVLTITMVTSAGETMLGTVELEWKEAGEDSNAGSR